MTADNDMKCSGTLSIAHLPEDVLYYILKKCSVTDLGVISRTCKLFSRLVRAEWLWKHLCKRDFHLSEDDLKDITSFFNLYKNILHKYGWFQGTYHTESSPYGGLLEVRFNAGDIEGVNYDTGSTDDVESPLQKYILFSIKGYQNSPEILCLPTLAPHSCKLTLDKRKGEIYQKCSNTDVHIHAICDNIGGSHPLKVFFLNDMIGYRHEPVLLPDPYDIPEELRLNNGTYPPQLITPGLYKGTYGGHGTEIILFKYKDENEIHGIKVTGDPNVFAGKISVKVSLRFPVDVSREDQTSFEVLKAIEPVQSYAPISDIKDQPFIVPNHCMTRGTFPPDRCKARYHGFGQIAYEEFQHPKFIAVHIMVFSSDYIGVLWLDLMSLSLFRRVKESFQENILPDIESSI